MGKKYTKRNRKRISRKRYSKNKRIRGGATGGATGGRRGARTPSDTKTVRQSSGNVPSAATPADDPRVALTSLEDRVRTMQATVANIKDLRRDTRESLSGTPSSPKRFATPKPVSTEAAAQAQQRMMRRRARYEKPQIAEELLNAAEASVRDFILAGHIVKMLKTPDSVQSSPATPGIKTPYNTLFSETSGEGAAATGDHDTLLSDIEASRISLRTLSNLVSPTGGDDTLTPRMERVTKETNPEKINALLEAALIQVDTAYSALETLDTFYKQAVAEKQHFKEIIKGLTRIEDEQNIIKFLKELKELADEEGVNPEDLTAVYILNKSRLLRQEISSDPEKIRALESEIEKLKEKEMIDLLAHSKQVRENAEAQIQAGKVEELNNKYLIELDRIQGILGTSAVVNYVSTPENSGLFTIRRALPGQYPQTPETVTPRRFSFDSQPKVKVEGPGY